MQPINYLGMMPQQDFLRDVQGGLQIGMSIRAAQQAQQQQEAAQQRQQQYQQAVQSYLQKPSVSGASALSLQFPERAKEIKDAWEMEDKTQRESTIKAALPFFSALNNGRSDLAQSLLEQRVAALQNSGQDASHEEQWLEQIKGGGADAVKGQLGLFLSAVHPEFSKNFATMGAEQRAADMAPVQLRKAQADAITAEVTADAAPEVVALGKEEVAEKIRTAAENRRIAALDVQIRQADSETKRGQLILDREKVVEEQRARQAVAGKTAQADGAAAQDALDSANALIDQIKGVQNHPGLEAGTGTMSGIRSFFNSTDANDFRKAVEGLKSPVFLNELSKLKAAGVSLGQVTEVEGKKLEQRIANLDPDQSTPSFKNQVGVLLKDTEKFIAKIQASGKLPTKGGAVVGSHPKYNIIDEGRINDAMKASPGATREQVIQFLRLSGGASGAY